ncbi:tetratricopeptide repeat protein [Herbaspirillum frisingense]|uniref:tetratricopeptide repeat protein n=1 Tax=Herbaspirillum frisingense TaxID=92645 RepID=UPI001F2F3A99|nr:tetratricopeptide repeat protein [Herbaspirillum frisingense]UIN21250.1 tetratricopeptide repeat protein [Herbaspirillum frisingense]
MRMNKIKTGLVIPALLLAVLSGCANTQPPKPSPEEEAKNTLESGVAQANTAQAEGKTDEAVTVLKIVASRFPADKTPWLRIAQIRFDSGDYSDAIVNAQEALKRDPSDKVANSIVTVSSLRLATKALGDLRTQNALNGSVKTEAQDLTKILRESLGETALVPPPAKPSPVAKRSRVQRKAAPAPAGDNDDSVSSPASNNRGSSGGSGPNPFGNLK